MAQNVTIAGASYPDVPRIDVPKTGGGTATFVDTSDADAQASEILSGKTAYVNGVKVVGSLGSGSPILKCSVNANDDVIGVDGFGFLKIPKYAFYNNEYLISADFSNSPDLYQLRTYAFQGCSNLTNVTLPNAVQYFDNNVFYGCQNLSLSSLPSGTLIIGPGVFYNCQSISLSSLPNGVQRIFNNAFYGCSRISIELLPSSLTEVQNGAFARCTGITNIEIACGKLGDQAYATYGPVFDRCTGLSKVWIRNTCESIFATSATISPFYNCSNLQTIYVEASQKPDGWGSYFNYISGNTQATVVYNQTTKPW